MAVESLVCLIWAAARFEQGAKGVKIKEGHVSGGSSDRNTSGLDRDNRTSSSGSGSSSISSSNGSVGNGSKSGSSRWFEGEGTADLEAQEAEEEDWDLLASSSSSSSSSTARMEPSPLTTACAWIPSVCARVARAVGSMSGSSLGCVVWGSGVLMGALATELSSPQRLIDESGSRGSKQGRGWEGASSGGVKQSDAEPILCSGRGGAEQSGAGLNMQGASSSGSAEQSGAEPITQGAKIGGVGQDVLGGGSRGGFDALGSEAPEGSTTTNGSGPGNGREAVLRVGAAAEGTKGQAEVALQSLARLQVITVLDLKPSSVLSYIPRPSFLK